MIVSIIYKAFIRNYRECEIGGIILGLRNDNEINAIKAVPILSTKDCAYSYSLDGCMVTDIVNSSEYNFVGIWHSHINSCNHFSKTDEMVNKEFAKTFGGIISILVLADNDGNTKVLPYFIGEGGKSKQCYELFDSI